MKRSEGWDLPLTEAARLEALEAFLLRLRQDVDGCGVLVEGQRDAAALENLGIGGTHLVLNRGRSLDGRADDVISRATAAGWPRLYLLMDWDRTGNRLQSHVEAALAGRTPVDTQARANLSRLVQCPSLEEVPAELRGLRHRVLQ
jgi:5S rRNA maturation endonuclease (ribonuclease M5)